MKFRRYVGFTVFGLILLLSLTILPSIKAQYTADGQAFTLVSPIFIASPENTTYTTNQVCLKFVVQSYVNARVNNMTMLYSLDGNDNVTILPINVVGDVDSGTGDGKTVVSVVSGSVTLEGLQPGSHSLTVFGIYATHQSPKTGFDSQTVYFTIDADSNSIVEPVSLTETTPVKYYSSYSFTAIVCVVAVLGLVSIVLYVLFIRRRSQINMGVA